MQPQRVGRARVSKVFEYDGNTVPLAMALPGVTSEDLAVLAGWHHDPSLGRDPGSGALELSFHSYVIEAAGRVFLVDTGLGNGKPRPEPVSFCDRLETDFLENLGALGLGTRDVHGVVCTHLHFDHVGWNTVWDGERWLPTFPDATYFLPAADVAHFGAGADLVSAPAYADSVQPVIDAGRTELVGDGDVILDEDGVRIRLESMAGHSPGTVAVWLESEGESVVFTGDLVHHPVQLVRPELCLSVEERPDEATATRRRLLDDVTDRDVLMFPAHFRGTSGGRVITNPHGPGRAWVPLP